MGWLDHPMAAWVILGGLIFGLLGISIIAGVLK